MDDTLELRKALEETDKALAKNSIEDSSKCMNERYGVNRAGRLDQSLPQDACTRCRSVYWSSLAQLESPSADFEREQLLIMLESQESLLKSACPLCRFLARIVPEHYEPHLRVLQVHPAHYRLTGGTTPHGNKRRASVIGLPDTVSDRTGTLGILHPNASQDDFCPRIIKPQITDYAILSDWLATCRSNHNCQSKRGDNLPGFKVIDCRTKKAIPALEDCSYVALSYVWGLPSKQTDQGQNRGFPLTIEDSIAVTLRLGLCYLWIDRYCIDQEDSPEKQAQIEQMDRIYNEAELTIIAAAGSDPSYGLPGVSSRFRKPQRAIEWGGITLIEVFPRTPFRLESVTWASRAWTYQESFLSRCRLIFTDRQTSFVCNAMYCAESIQCNAQDYPGGLQLSRFYHLIPGARNHPPMIAALASLGADTMAYVKEYSKRKLSYDSDALNALLGILTSVEKTTDVAHVWGIPAHIEDDQADRPRPNVHLVHNYFALCWYHIRPGRRRAAFPSWSWVGWDGHVGDLPPGVLASHRCEMDVVLLDDSSISLVSYVRTGLAKEHAGKPDAPQLLKITAPTLCLSFVQASSYSDTPISKELFRFQTWAKVPIGEGVCRLACVCLDEELTSTNQLSNALAVVLWDRRELANPVFLLVKQIGERYRRVGLVDLEGRGDLPYSPYVDDAGNTVKPNASGDPVWLKDCQSQTMVLE